jgi:hypothetical protein
MILVPSRLQLSNGNKILSGIIFLILISACSLKTTQVKIPEKVGPAKVPPVSVREIPAKTRNNSIALILPFYLHTFSIKNVSEKDITKANLALDFYQGFKLALDSLAAEGYNFDLKVFDSQDQKARILNLAKAKAVLAADLVIGPVFPDQVKVFGENANLDKKIQVSPLAASQPNTFLNPHLVTVNNTIDQHARKVADFINSNYLPDEVNLVLINTQEADDSKFANPIKSHFKSIASDKFKINERPNSKGIESALRPDRNNLVIIASDEVDFVVPTINRLYALTKSQYKIELFGHPNWLKVKNLDTDKLQWLNTHVTSSYFIDFSSTEVKQFVARYVDDYTFQPSEFAFKGFDSGYYFGKLIARYGQDYTQHLSDEIYKGLHNNFSFKQDVKSGFVNTELIMLQYNGFELQKIK